MVFARQLLPEFPDCSAIDIFFKRAWNRDKNGVERSNWDLFKSDRIPASEGYGGPRRDSFR